MNIIYNQDGTILLTPETEKESIGIAYELSRKGSVALKNKLEEHYNQRFLQRNYETTRDINKEISTLPEKDRLEVITITRAEIEKRKPINESIK